ncbi:unnamed protein product [Malus baccata var. baccata]
MVILLSLSITCVMVMAASAGNFYQDFDVTFGDGRAKTLNGGQLLTLNLDQASGSGFKSMNEYLFGRIDMQIKLLSSEGPTHDEIDFEFLGNVSRDPYTLHTNVFSQGKGNREQFLVDNIPIRVSNNLESVGVPFPENKPMRIYSSFEAPFTASYRNFKANACTAGSSSSCASIASTNSVGGSAWQTQGLDAAGHNRLRWVQQKFVYNYCNDLKRFPQGLPAECRRSRF